MGGSIIGSINLAPGSFNSRREVAIESRYEYILQRVHKTVHHDWENSQPLDISHDGLLADFGERKAGEVSSST